MARTSHKVGRGLCPSKGCGESVYYFLSSGGNLTHECHGCGSTGYASSRGDAYNERIASIKDPVMPGATLTPVAAAVAEVVAPPKAKRNSVFSMGEL